MTDRRGTNESQRARVELSTPHGAVVEKRGVEWIGKMSSNVIPWIAIVLVCSATPQLSAQNADTPAFEVASVKPNEGGRGVSLAVQPGGRFTARNVALRELIRFAYQVQPFQIEGNVKILGERFDVVAKAENELPPIRPGIVGPVNLMVRTLLAERFKLQVHRESKELSIYELVVARSDGKLGRQIQSRTGECESPRGRATPGSSVPTQAGDRPACGATLLGLGRIVTGGIAMSQFTQTLTSIVGRGVLDRTGLAGVYTFELDFAPDQQAIGTAAQSGVVVSQADPSRPSVFTALEEQLGLKLRSTRGPVEVLVIDHVEHPTPD